MLIKLIRKSSDTPISWEARFRICSFVFFSAKDKRRKKWFKMTNRAMHIIIRHYINWIIFQVGRSSTKSQLNNSDISDLINIQESAGNIISYQTITFTTSRYHRIGWYYLASISVIYNKTRQGRIIDYAIVWRSKFKSDDKRFFQLCNFFLHFWYGPNYANAKRWKVICDTQ